MTQKTIRMRMFINQIYSESPRNILTTNKTDVYHIDDFWGSDKLETKDYGPDNNRFFRYFC